jgi:ATP-dependent DNA helicase RecG
VHNHTWISHEPVIYLVLMVNPDTAIDKCFRLTDKQKSALRKLQIHTANDLLFHFPSRYEDFSQIKLIADSEVGEKVVVVGILRKLEASRTWTTKIPVAKARVYDESGVLDVVWFRQPYMATMLHDETPVKLTGTITQTNKRRTMTNPVVEKIASISLKHDEQTTPNIILPVYPESQGITSRWFYYAVNKLMNGGILECVEDALPQDILLKYHLPAVSTALRVIHSPRSGSESEAARKRFAFEEVLYIQLAKQKERDSMRKQKSFTINKHINDLEPLMSQYPFAPTNAQTKAILAILDDFGRPSAMSRLLEGDVGSGKTLVAAATAFAVAGEQFEGTSAPLQVAYMAPTEILARQHFETFLTYFKGLSIPIGLITGSVCMKFPSKVNPGSATQLSRAQFLRFVERGEIPIVIGTHSLIQKSLQFKHLAYVIIDERLYLTCYP